MFLIQFQAILVDVDLKIAVKFFSTCLRQFLCFFNFRQYERTLVEKGTHPRNYCFSLYLYVSSDDLGVEVLV
jgi:hypothetical protein